MKRVAIGVGGLAAVVVAAVVAYLLLVSGSPDRAARAVPQGATVYANLYLQQSTAQRTQLYDLLGRLPGFGDAATLDTKIHQLAQRFIGDQGIDYQADLLPWLGNQVAVALTPGASLSDPPHLLLVAAVKGPGVDDAMQRISADLGLSASTDDYQGVDLHLGQELSWAALDDLLIVADTADGVRAALDADAGRAPALADSSTFRSAMQRVPGDHLGTIFIDLGTLVGADAEQVAGYSSVVMALLAAEDGLHVVGEAPFGAGLANDLARQAFALGSQPTRLPDWLPAGTGAEVVIVGLRQALLAIEEQAADEPALQPLADALNQLRAIGALAMGINVDRDLLPLLDREVAVAMVDIPGGDPAPLLLLRPDDPEAAAASLARMRDALVERGSPMRTVEAAGIEISGLEVPQLGSLAYAMDDGVVVLGLGTDVVAAMLEARAAGDRLAPTAGYRAAFEAAGGRGGSEAWIDGGGMERLAELSGLDAEMRAILARIGALAMTAPARDDRLEIHAVLTVN